MYLINVMAAQRDFSYAIVAVVHETQRIANVTNTKNPAKIEKLNNTLKSDYDLKIEDLKRKKLNNMCN